MNNLNEQMIYDRDMLISVFSCFSFRVEKLAKAISAVTLTMVGGSNLGRSF